MHHIFIAFPRRQSSLMHCWKSVGNVEWLTNTRTLPCFFGSLSVTHIHSHVPLCWHVLQRWSVFIRSQPSLLYLELLMQWAMWTWNWKQMLNSAAKSLWLPWPYRLFLVRLSVACVCVWDYVCLFDPENHFLDDTFRMWVNCVSQKPKDFGASCTLFPPNALIWPLLCCLSWLKSSTWNLVNVWLIG